MTGYKLRERAPEAAHTVLHGYPELLRELLCARGVTSRVETEVFLHPDYARHTHDPFLLTGMRDAVARIMRALADNERIVVFADYDHDGIPGAVILSDFFKMIGYERTDVYIPHRNTEGFGLRVPAVEKLAARGVKLIITVDCGITAVDAVARARECGIDVVVTDHHAADGTLPGAVAIVNPKQEGDSYPFKELCGSGVVFKLVQALVERLKTENLKLKTLPERWEESLLDLVAVATIGDMVSLTGENRVLAHAGLMALRKTERPGLKALIGVAKLTQDQISEDDVAFMITPRINAASRMDTPELAFNLLAAKSALEAEPLVAELNHINDRRKGAVASIVKEAHKRLEKREGAGDVVVVGDLDWQPGLLGLAANAVMEKEGKTAFLWGQGDADDIKGSCRSLGSVDVVALMREMPADTFVEFGGHTNSGGFSITREKLYHLEEGLNGVFTTLNGASVRDEEVYIDAALSLSDVTWETYAQVELMGPFGAGNHKPLFLFRSVVVSEVKHFGNDKNHLGLTLEQGEVKGISAMSFFNTSDSFGKPVEKGSTIDLLAHLEKSVFRGTPELRLRIVNIIKR